MELYQHTWRVAQNKRAPRWMLALLASGRGWANRRSTGELARSLIAQNPNAGRGTLRRIAAKRDWAQRTWVAVNPAAGRRPLRRLAGDDHWNVRECATSNPATPRRAVERLAADRRREVRAAVAVIIVITDGHTPWPATRPPAVAATVIAVLTEPCTAGSVPRWITSIEAFATVL